MLISATGRGSISSFLKVAVDVAWVVACALLGFMWIIAAFAVYSIVSGNSTFLDLTSYRGNGALPTEGTALASFSFNLALVLERAEDPSGLLTADWASRQKQLAEFPDLSGVMGRGDQAARGKSAALGHGAFLRRGSWGDRAFWRPSRVWLDVLIVFRYGPNPSRQTSWRMASRTRALRFPDG